MLLFNYRVLGSEVFITVTNKRGFTLVEIIAVVVILALVGLIVVPAVLNSINNTKETAYNTMVNNIESVTKLYISENKGEIANINVINSNIKVSLQQLIDSGLIKAPIQDPMTGEPINPANKKISVCVIGKNEYFVSYVDIPSCEARDFVGPIITLYGDDPITVYLNHTYTDPGAKAEDAKEGDVSTRITYTSNVDVSKRGKYAVTYNATDSVGNKAETVVRTVNVIDIEGPIISCNPSGDTSYAKTRSTVCTVADDGGVDTTSVKSLWNNTSASPIESTFTTSYTSGTAISSPSSVTGGYYLHILAKDNSGNATIYNTSVFNLDNGGPIISGINFNGYTTGTCTNGNITVSINATDAYSNIATYQYSTNGGSSWNNITSTWTINSDYNSSTLFKVTDNVANYTITSYYPIMRDATVPPKPGTPDLAAASDTGYSSTDNLTKNTSVTLSGSGAEASNTLYIYDNGTLIGSTTTASDGTWSKVVTLAVANGSNSITVRSMDGCTNYSSYSDPLVITVDTTNPAVAVSKDPTDWTADSIYVSATCTDTNLYSCRKSGDTINAVTGTSYTLGYYTQSIGYHTFIGTDKAGNEITSSTTIASRTQYRYIDKYATFNGSSYLKSVAGIYGLYHDDGDRTFTFGISVIFDYLGSSDIYLFDTGTSDGDPRATLFYSGDTGDLELYIKYNGNVYIAHHYDFHPVTGVYYDIWMDGGADWERGYDLFVNGDWIGYSGGSCYRFSVNNQYTYIGSRYNHANYLTGRVYSFQFDGHKADVGDYYYFYVAASTSSSSPYWYPSDIPDPDPTWIIYDDAFRFNSTGVTFNTYDSGWTDTKAPDLQNEQNFRTRTTRLLYQ